MGQELRDIYRRFRRIVGDIIQQGVDDGIFKKDIPPAAVAAAVVGSWDGLGVQAWFDPDFKIEKTARAFMVLIISGMMAEN